MKAHCPARIEGRRAGHPRRWRKAIIIATAGTAPRA